MGFFRRKKQKKDAAVCSVVVVAAGSSSRMGQDKIMWELRDVPVIVHTLRAFEETPEVREIVVVTREDQLAEVARLCHDYGLSKVSKVIRGGASRTESARLGTLEADHDAALIGIHDGARPFVTPELIGEVIRKAAVTGAAAPAVPVTDTIKVARDGVVEQTLDRAVLYAVQTPQVFEASLIRAALQKALDDGAELTDDCGAVERMGMQVSLTEGDPRNIKLTTPADLAWSEGILAGDVV